jgi:hypothetical protein
MLSHFKHTAALNPPLDSTRLFEAFQENQAKWAEVAAGIYDEYIRGEGTHSPTTQKLKWDREHLWYNERQDTDQEDCHCTSNLTQPPKSVTQTEPYETPETTTIDLSQNTDTPSPPQIRDANTSLTQRDNNPTLSTETPNTKSEHAITPTWSNIKASYAESFYPLELAMEDEAKQRHNKTGTMT